MARKPAVSPATPAPTPTPAVTGSFATKTPAQQRAITHNAAIGDLQQAQKLAIFWTERNQPTLADLYRKIEGVASGIVQTTLPPAQVSDTPELMLAAVKSHAARKAWVNTQSYSDATLLSVIAGAKTVAGAIAKAAVAEKAPR